MAIILAIIVAGFTIAATLLILLADGMSDAPSVQGISVWPTLIIGFGVAGLLAGSHWVHIPW